MTTTVEQQMRRALGLDLVDAARHGGALLPAAKTAAERQPQPSADSIPPDDDSCDWSIAQLLHGRLC